MGDTHFSLMGLGKLARHLVSVNLILNDDSLEVDGRLFYAPVYMVAFLKADPLPEKMIYTID